MHDHSSSEQIRAAFLSFFRERRHEIVPSGSLVPGDDPTLLFTNAGMNQFKDVFLGEGSRDYVRAADSQKCLRVSGKHNDLEEVGHDTYHHTFFEMLGNWSFGDYFKKEAIGWAWELLTDRFGLDPDRLYATVHEGDDALGLDPDTEAADLWKSETPIKPEHVLFGATKDNFWMMGDTGPCGPCSEIHVDLRSDEERARAPGQDLVNKDDPRVMEIWNLVFIQYNAKREMSEEGREKREPLLERVEQAGREEDTARAREALRRFDDSEEGWQTTLEPLAAKHVDTGMGFERLVAILQQKSSNYDTDLFAPLLQTIADLSPRPEINGYDAIDADAEREKIRIAMRVVADHVRAIAFAVADGAVPGNTGRGYVIRRILRRAVRYGYQTLGFRAPFLFRLVEPLIVKMGASFPELERHRTRIERTIRAEEESFLNTLGTGIAFFERITPYLNALATAGSDGHDASVFTRLEEDSKALNLLHHAYVDSEERAAIFEQFAASAQAHNVPGEVAFLLHDTYGFPIDLTQLMAREEGFGVDMARYNELMRRQRERARSASAFGGTAQTPSGPDHKAAVEATIFEGYERNSVAGARILDARATPAGEDEERYAIVLDRTPFYAESGGQVGDTGLLRVGDEEIRVLDTQKADGLIVHTMDRLPEALDAPVEAIVDAARRARIKKHHTVTHLMHAALRETLGTHVAQQGSLVAPGRLRFDFSHFERVTPEELRRVEQRVNAVIQRNVLKQEDREVPYDEAVARGAMALFGEKYGDTVRVITFDADYSVELCGGIHVDATGEIGVFRFLSEGSIAAGVRRVEAVAGRDALAFIDREVDELDRVRGQFRALQRPTDEEVADLIDQNRRLEKELEQVRQQNLAAGLDAMIQQARPVGSVRLVTGRVDDADMDTLRALGQTLRDRLGEHAVGVLGTVDPDGEKVYLVATVSDDLVQDGDVKAGALVGQLAKRVGGGGGGRPTLATAGGRQPENLDAALVEAAAVLGAMLG